MDVQFGYINDDFIKNQYRLKINGVFYKCKDVKRDKFKHVSDDLYLKLVLYKIIKINILKQGKHTKISKEALREINYIGFIK